MYLPGHLSNFAENLGPGLIFLGYAVVMVRTQKQRVVDVHPVLEVFFKFTKLSVSSLVFVEQI